MPVVIVQPCVVNISALSLKSSSYLGYAVVNRIETNLKLLMNGLIMKRQQSNDPFANEFLV